MLIKKLWQLENKVVKLPNIKENSPWRLRVEQISNCRPWRMPPWVRWMNEGGCGKFTMEQTADGTCGLVEREELTLEKVRDPVQASETDMNHNNPLYTDDAQLCISLRNHRICKLKDTHKDPALCPAQDIPKSHTMYPRVSSKHPLNFVRFSAVTTSLECLFQHPITLWVKNIQSKPLLIQLHAISLGPVTGHHRGQISVYPSSSPHKEGSLEKSLKRSITEKSVFEQNFRKKVSGFGTKERDNMYFLQSSQLTSMQSLCQELPGEVPPVQRLRWAEPILYSLAHVEHQIPCEEPDAERS
ncbi:hypothetical protein BTVI_20587 [Pitangus sulphuratus]|nr:hypothetical protein BTVI_20587 [Pitangus sulphuratus]